jgi:hypothetical protein
MDTNFFAVCAMRLLVSAAVLAAIVTSCGRDACLYSSSNCCGALREIKTAIIDITGLG